MQTETIKNPQEVLETALISASTSLLERPAHILVIDDEEQNRTLLKDPLEARGYEVTEFESALDAMKTVLERPPDVILLDVMMPGMDGFSFCRVLRQRPSTKAVPILMITALSERHERLMGIEAGASDFLNKPVDLQEVLLRVQNAAHTKRLYDQLEAERAKSERLLLNILPKPIATRMAKGEVRIADTHPEVSVLVADLVGFTILSELIAPDQVVSFLDEIFTRFDELVEKHGLEKIKTIGDAYLVAGGLFSKRQQHAQSMMELARDMKSAVEQLNQQYGTSICIRIGVSIGPVVAGVIGQKKFAYDLWGATVNLAFQLESCAQPGEILVSQELHDRLRTAFHFEAEKFPNPKGGSDLMAHRLIAAP
jgi:class 3 adenylate cyclase